MYLTLPTSDNRFRLFWKNADDCIKFFCCLAKVSYITRWVGRQDSVGPAPPFFDSGGPQTGVWWTKMEGEEFTDDMKIEFEPNKR